MRYISGDNTFLYDDIYKINIGDTNLFNGNPSKKCCLVILTKKGTILSETKCERVRDGWIHALEEKPRRYSIVSVENWTNEIGNGVGIARQNHIKKYEERQRRKDERLGYSIAEDREYTFDERSEKEHESIFAANESHFPDRYYS